MRTFTVVFEENLTEGERLGREIRITRIAAGVSRFELSRLLFIAVNTLGKYERGEVIPDALTMRRLSEILKIEVTSGKRN
jgi:transcriptional regulator with XRE-family HTH domain